jgi:Thioesterase-like superfamily
MNLQSLLSQIGPDQPTHRLTIPASWHQGRTSFGGLSAVLAFHAARQTASDLPPLQSGQIAFVGPLAGEIEVTTHILRRGRNSAFVQSTISSDGAVGLSCIFIFMAQRESAISFNNMQPPEFPPIPADDMARSGPPEFFTSHMQYPEKRLELGLNTSRLANWHRLKEFDGVDPLASIICVADALPPSAMGLMSEKGMVSSMNWQFNMLTDTPDTEAGWWFIESQTHKAAHGASSQYMTAWNSRGEPIMAGMQSVAIFV